MMRPDGKVIGAFVVSAYKFRQNRTWGSRIRLFGSVCQNGNTSCPDACTWWLSSSQRVASDTSLPVWCGSYSIGDTIVTIWSGSLIAKFDARSVGGSG